MKPVMLVLALALAACGSRQQLVRPAGEAPPPVPAAAEKTPTADELITPDEQARPTRSDEALKRSELRVDDRFELPPTL